MAEKTVARSIAIAYPTTPEHVLTLYAALGDIGLVAAQVCTEVGSMSQGLPVDDVFQGLQTIAQTAGKGTVEKRIALLADLLKHMDSLSAKYVVRIPVGKLRLGIGDATMLDALATTKFHDPHKRPLLEQAYNKTSDLGLIARTLWQHPNEDDAQRAVAHLDVQVGKPIRSQLAERLPDAETIMEKMGVVDVQYKYDGLRTQIHKDGQQVCIFSRNLEDMSAMFPEIIGATRTQVHAKSAILDAEASAYLPASEEFLPFQQTTRRRRKYNIEAMAQQMPLKAFVFDILYKDGTSLLEQPLVERLSILAATIAPGDILVPTAHHIVRDATTLSLLFEEAISKGLEGLVVKKPDSPYEAGARNFNWVKLKRHSAGALQDTIDCVLLGYLFGRGKRAAFGVGALLVGVYDKQRDLFVTVSKIGTGLSDEEWQSIRQRTEGLVVDHKPARIVSLIEPSVWVEPALVIEVLADEITRSPLHTAGKVGAEPGYALRFPRLVAFREDDKKPEDATTVEELIELYGVKDNATPNTGGRAMEQRAQTPDTQQACRFCQIIRRDIPSAIVFEDDTSLAFLDRRPLFPGHCLLVPNVHVETLADLPAPLVAPLFQNAQRIERAIEERLEADGTFVAINNRVSQSVPHLHIHLVPRHKKDGLKGFFWPRKPYKDQETMLHYQTLLRSALMPS